MDLNEVMRMDGEWKPDFVGTSHENVGYFKSFGTMAKIVIAWLELPNYIQ